VPKLEEFEKPPCIFVIADTHNRLPDSMKEMARDADEIWHLGDVCAEAILDDLDGKIDWRIIPLR
jgi:predicted phosphodiesterase